MRKLKLSAFAHNRGADTTYHLLGNVLHTLLNDAELLELVSNDRSKIEPLLWESLRWESPVQFVSRATNREVEIGGTVIPDDSMVTVLIGSANRDERAFENPDVCDINAQERQIPRFRLRPSLLRGKGFWFHRGHYRAECTAGQVAGIAI